MLIVWTVIRVHSHFTHYYLGVILCHYFDKGCSVGRGIFSYLWYSGVRYGSAGVWIRGRYDLLNHSRQTVTCYYITQPFVGLSFRHCTTTSIVYLYTNNWYDYDYWRSLILSLSAYLIDLRFGMNCCVTHCSPIGWLNLLIYL